MKKFLTIMILAIAVTTSCTQDVYEKGEGDWSKIVAEICDGYTASDSMVTRFVTDDGVAYVVSNPFNTSLMLKPDTIFRAVFYYEKDGEKAEVKGLNRVAVISPREIDNVKTDPVRLESMWMGKTKRYINLSVYMMVGVPDSDDAAHQIACSRDSVHQNDDGSHTLFLTFYHDQGNVPEYYSQRYYVSIPMQSGAADSVCLRVNTYDGMLDKRLIIK